MRKLLSAIVLLIALLLAPEPAKADAPAIVDMATELGDFISNCPACQLVGEALYIGNGLAQQAYDRVAQKLLPLLSAGFTLWIVMVAVDLMLPIGSPPAGSTIRKLMNKGLVFACVAGALSGPAHGLFWDYIYQPIVGMSAGYANDLITMSSSTYSNTAGATCTQPSPPSTVTVDANTQATVKEIVSAMCSMNKVMAGGIVVGGTMVADGATSVWDLKPLQIISGVALIIAFGLCIITFPLYFLNVAFSLTFVSVLSPALIAAYVLPVTRPWPLQALKLMIGSGAKLVSAGVVFGLIAGMMSLVPGMVMDTGSSSASMTDLLNWLANPTKFNAFNFTNAGFWCMLLAGLMAPILTPQVSHLATALVGTSGVNPFSQQIGSLQGMEMKSTMAPAGALLSGMGQGVGAVGRAAAGRLGAGGESDPVSRTKSRFAT